MSLEEAFLQPSASGANGYCVCTKNGFVRHICSIIHVRGMRPQLVFSILAKQFLYQATNHDLEEGSLRSLNMKSPLLCHWEMSFGDRDIVTQGALQLVVILVYLDSRSQIFDHAKTALILIMGLAGAEVTRRPTIVELAWATERLGDSPIFALDLILFLHFDRSNAVC